MVLEVIEDLNLEVTFKDTLMNPEFGSEHLKITGRRTVPCLYIDGRPMFESRDIIRWLNDNQARLTKVDHGNS